MDGCNRREFVRLAGAVGLGSAAPFTLAPDLVRHQDLDRSRGAAKMKVGTQHGDSDPILRVLAGLGVNNICSRLPSERLDEKWSVDGLSRLRERVESFGMALDIVPLPMSSNEIALGILTKHDVRHFEARDLIRAHGERHDVKRNAE